MKPARPQAQHNPLTGTGGANTYRSQCKSCGRAVHTWQDAKWSTDPQALGLVHTNCQEWS